jgi:hypothetical protein
MMMIGIFPSDAFYDDVCNQRDEATFLCTSTFWPHLDTPRLQHRASETAQTLYPPAASLLVTAH